MSKNFDAEMEIKNIKNKKAVFIDGSNFWQTCKRMGLKVDFERVRHLLSQQNTVWLGYYSALVKVQGKDNPIVKLIDWLSYNGYVVVTKQAHVIETKEGEKIIKGNVDVEIAVDMMLMAKSVDTIILFSGDGDFVSAIEAVQRHYGVYVIIISAAGKKVNTCASELQKQANLFIDIEDIAHLIIDENEIPF